MKKTGWIFRIKGKKRVYSSGYGFFEEDIPTTRKLSEAVVVSTRKQARQEKADNETILRVMLSKEGKPKKIFADYRQK